MTPGDIANVVIAVVGVIGLVIALLAWFFRRGGQETAISIALDRNTTATDRLTEKLDGVVVKLHDHDIRLTKLETHHEANLNGSAPAHRDARPQGGHSPG